MLTISPVARGDSCSRLCARSSTSSSSWKPRPPSAVKNFRPLSCQGWWLAVTMMDPSGRKPSVRMAMYMAGVVHIP